MAVQWQCNDCLWAVLYFGSTTDQQACLQVPASTTLLLQAVLETIQLVIVAASQVPYVVCVLKVGGVRCQQQFTSRGLPAVCCC